MKRWLVAFVVTVSVSAAAFATLILPTHANGVPDTVENEQSYAAAACYAASHGLPPLPPLHFDNGNSMMAVCDVNSA
jgi:hypothetical protein